MSRTELRKVITTLLMGHLNVDAAMTFIETDRLSFGLGTQIIMWKNLPFYDVPDIGYVPVLSRFYGVFRYLYQDVLAKGKTEPSPFVRYPTLDLIIEDDVGYTDINFGAYVRKANKASHFFGAKSQSVAWTWQAITPELADASYDLAIHHYQSYVQRHPDSDDYKLYLPEWISYGKCQGYAVMAHQGSKLVAMMFLVPVFDILHCKMMALSHEPELKPYSLAICAHIAAIKCALDNEYGMIDLGLNDGSAGDYKFTLPDVHVPEIRTLISL